MDRFLFVSRYTNGSVWQLSWVLTWRKRRFLTESLDMEPRRNLESRGTSDGTHRKSYLHTFSLWMHVYWWHVCVSHVWLFVRMHVCLYPRLYMRLLNGGHADVLYHWCSLLNRCRSWASSCRVQIGAPSRPRFVYDIIINRSLLRASMEGISSRMIWLALIDAV